MSLRQFLLILRARRLAALSIFLLVTAGALAVTLAMPRRYEATAQVMVDIRSPDPLGTLLPVMASAPYMATQVEVLRSERVARAVVASLGLDRDEDMLRAWRAATAGRGDPVEWIAAELRRRLDVRPPREGNVLAVTVSQRDAQRAADLANAFSRAFVEITVELRTQPAKRSSSFFDERVRALRRELETAQTRLTDYQRKHGITVTDERLDVENVRLGDLSAQLAAIQSQGADARARDGARATGEDATPEAMSNPVIQNLRVDIARLEARVRDTAQRLGAAHPTRLAQQQELESLRARLSSETQRIGAMLSASARAAGQREAEIRGALEAQRARVLRLKQHRDEVLVLQRDVEAAQRALDNVTQRQAQASLESQATLTNVVILSEAQRPVRPASPNAPLNLVVGAMLGAAAAVGMALALESARRRLRSDDDLMALVGEPVLAVVPRAACGPVASPRFRLPGPASSSPAFSLLPEDRS